MRKAEYTSDEIDSILMSRIKQAENVKYKDKVTCNGDSTGKRDTRVLTRINYAEYNPDPAKQKTQKELDVEFRQKRLATAVVIVEKEHKFMVIFYF